MVTLPPLRKSPVAGPVQGCGSVWSGHIANHLLCFVWCITTSGEWRSDLTHFHLGVWLPVALAQKITLVVYTYVSPLKKCSSLLIEEPNGPCGCPFL